MTGKAKAKRRRSRLARRRGYSKVYRSFKKDCAGIKALVEGGVLSVGVAGTGKSAFAIGLDAARKR